MKHQPLTEHVVEKIHDLVHRSFSQRFGRPFALTGLRKACWRSLDGLMREHDHTRFVINKPVIDVHHGGGGMIVISLNDSDFWGTHLGEDIHDILDYVDHVRTSDATRFAKLHTSPFMHLADQSRSWHRNMAKRKRVIAGDEGTADRIDSEDRYWVRLVTVDALDREGDYMGHCVGRGSYDRYVEMQPREGGIWSLRDEKGRSILTSEYLNIEGDALRLMQIRGMDNEWPGFKTDQLRRHLTSLHLFFMNNLDMDRIDWKTIGRNDPYEF